MNNLYRRLVDETQRISCLEQVCVALDKMVELTILRALVLNWDWSDLGLTDLVQAIPKLFFRQCESMALLPFKRLHSVDGTEDHTADPRSMQ